MVSLAMLKVKSVINLGFLKEYEKLEHVWIKTQTGQGIS